MRTFKEKVARRVTWWAVSTVVVLALVLAMGYATIRMIVGIPQDVQAMFLYVFGCAGLAIAYFLGQAVNTILVRSWDTWLSDLGPTQIDVLVKEMEKRKMQLEKEEEI
jgi:hypothetical protein